MSATLEQLEGVWPEPDVHTSLIDTCHRLRRVPIDDLTASDIRILLGQQIGARHLVSRAIELLEVDPFVEASYFPGDLLMAALRADENRFRGFPKIHFRLRAIAEKARIVMVQQDQAAAPLQELPSLLVEYLGS